MANWIKQKLSQIRAFADNDLVDRAKRGDGQAFGKLYLKYLDAIYRYVFFRVNQSQPDAEDITEIVFLKAWQNVHSFKSKDIGFKAWIYKIARNQIIDHYRNYKKPEKLKENNIDKTQDLENTILQKLEVKNVLKAMDNLSPEHKQILMLKYIEDLTNEEICAILDKSNEAVRALQSRALKKLREIVS